MIKSEAFGIIIYYLDDEEFKQKAREKGFSIIKTILLKGFCCVQLGEIYINDEARYLFKHSKDRLKLHELGHAIGFDHSYNPFNVMFPIIL